MHSNFEGFVPLFLKRTRLRPSAVFATHGSKTITFAEMERRSRSFAANAKRFGLAAGDRVAIMLPNSPSVMACLYGIARAGLAWIPINPEQRGSNLAYLLEHSDPAMIIGSRRDIDELKNSGGLPGAARLVAVSENGRELEALLDGDEEYDAPIPSPDEIFSIMYTSGTTGRPKGVLVTHQMMRHASEAAIMLADARDGDVLFMWEPLYHIGGAQVLLMPLLREVRLALVPRFSASCFWKQVRECGATHIHYLGGVLQILMKQAASAMDKEHNVRVAWGAGCQPEIWDAFRDRFGVELREAYGMTETASIATINGEGVAGSMGYPVPWFDIDIIDHRGLSVPHGVRGEIVVRPKQDNCVFPGYFKDPDASARVLRGGAVHTQDIGAIDAQGALVFHGRMTDSIRCRGENVSAWEVEHVARTHEAVEDCAAIGVKAEIGEQEIKLFVQLKPGCPAEPAKLSSWLAARLAPFQNPRYIAFVDAFARTPSQRIIKHVLPADVGHCWDRMENATHHRNPNREQLLDR